MLKRTKTAVESVTTTANATTKTLVLVSAVAMLALIIGVVALARTGDHG